MLEQKTILSKMKRTSYAQNIIVSKSSEIIKPKGRNMYIGA
jgi:hypothetical protein